MVTQWHLLKETTAFTSAVWSGWQVLRVGNVNEKLQGDEVNTLAHLCGVQYGEVEIMLMKVVFGSSVMG